MASDSPTLSLGDGSGTGILSGITNFLQNGGSAVRVFTASLTGVVVAPFIAFADIIQAVTTFFTAPFTEVGESITALAGALFQAPAGLVETGFTTSEEVLTAFFGSSFAGVFAGPVAVGLVMLSLFLVTQYLQEDETGDTIPGLPVDVPTETLGVEEEDPGEDS